VATKKERQRRLARERYERRQQRRADKDRRARRWASSGIIAVLVVGVGLGSAALAGTFSGKSTPTASPSNSPSAALSPSASASPGPTSALVNGKCVYTKTGAPARKVSLPPATPVKGTYQATVATNRGTIIINLLASKAPCTVNSFISLAGQKYFNATPCHRLTTKLIYVLQCGDPTGTGTGGPGYEFYSENLTGAKYPAGTVAMANSGQPNSNGSQFFLVYKNTNLPPSYTPFGTIVKGLNIIQNVAKAGTDNGSGDGHPKEKVQINSVTIKKT
jgi:peptidyl-prolyl cis-trans isomerase B (cyclophilin B)